MTRHRLKFAAGLALTLVLVLAALMLAKQAGHFWERILVFEAAFGFLGCLLLVIVSKALGRLFIQKREDYYDD